MDASSLRSDSTISLWFGRAAYGAGADSAGAARSAGGEAANAAQAAAAE